jgi:hypothetical protein
MKQKEEATLTNSEKKELAVLDTPKESLTVILDKNGDMRP